MRGEGMENLVTTGKIQGKRDSGMGKEKKWLGVKDNKEKIWGCVS
jgi:hypothetical protein